MAKATSKTDQATSDATLVFLAKTTYQDKADRELRLVIKTLRDLLLSRQQERAAKRYESSGGKSNRKQLPPCPDCGGILKAVGRSNPPRWKCNCGKTFEPKDINVMLLLAEGEQERQID